MRGKEMDREPRYTVWVLLLALLILLSYIGYAYMYNLQKKSENYAPIKDYNPYYKRLEKDISYYLKPMPFPARFMASGLSGGDTASPPDDGPFNEPILWAEPIEVSSIYDMYPELERPPEGPPDIPDLSTYDPTEETLEPEHYLYPDEFPPEETIEEPEPAESPPLEESSEEQEPEDEEWEEVSPGYYVKNDPAATPTDTEDEALFQLFSAAEQSNDAAMQEINTTLKTILGIVLLAISGFIVYLIFKPFMGITRY